MNADRFAWIGPTAGYEPLLQALTGNGCSADDLPDGWVTNRSPGEAAVGADFIFVRGDVARALARGVLTDAPPGACVVMIDADPAECRSLAETLDDAGLDGLDLALLRDPARFAVGGHRDTFNMLKPALAGVGRPFFCGAVGSATFTAAAEMKMASVPRSATHELLADLFANGEAFGAFPQALRNVWKAGPLADEEFDAEADRLTKR